MKSGSKSSKGDHEVKREINITIGLIGILLTAGILFTVLLLNSSAASASDVSNTPQNTAALNAQDQNPSLVASATAYQDKAKQIKRFRSTTPLQRRESAVRIAKIRKAAGTVITPSALTPGGTPDYFGTIPNYANSPLPTVVWNTGNFAVTGGMRKFVDSLPGLAPAGANNLGQYIPVAVPDTTTYTGSDYYEIGLVQYTEKMHSDLNATTLRGYVQLSTTNVPGAHIPLRYPNGTIITSVTGAQVFAVDNPHYLGPLIIAQRDRPVRVKFINYLPTGVDGNLFIPVDTTIAGAGDGPTGCTLDAMGMVIMGTCKQYTQNRATIHLHGGNTPWISDGTQDQWTTPAGENTAYPKGITVKDVPDMDNGTEPNGTMTFYYTNQQGARLMFYHDHAYGITRLNVYAGVAAAYLETDSVEQGLISSGILPDVGIPLVIQDRTFLPDNLTLAAQDPTWPFTVNASRSDLWWPHVYMPNQNPAFGPQGVNQMGRWDYGPWSVPPANASMGPVANPLFNPNAPWENSMNPGTPNPSIVPEAFVDTTIVNGNAYPYVNLGKKAYRFRILNAANDRAFNLQLYYASTAGPFVKITGGGGVGASARVGVNATGSITSITVTSGGAGYTAAPNVTISDAPGHVPAGSGASSTAIVDLTVGSPTYGTVTSITVTNAGINYSVPTMCKGPSAPNRSLCTEVSMVPAIPGAAQFPVDWNATTGNATNPYAILDGRAEGVPDPAAIGPTMVQIGTEGGFLPAPISISNRPIGFDYNNSIAGVLNVREKALLLGGAERADVVVDFSGVPDNSTLILYNDAPSPLTGSDPRYDYFTDNPDNTITGGAPSTLPGYGPNTRTIMQFRINASIGTAPAFNMASLTTALPVAYAQSQDELLVPESAYNTPYNANYVDNYVGLLNTSITFTPVGSAGPVTMNLKPKSINDGFDPMYGGLMTTLGVEIPSGRVPIPYNLWDPPTEIIKNSDLAVPIGTLADGTQIWRVYSNSVDTHPMHWHMFTVQVINRINQITGVITPPDPNEQGRRETLRMNPLEDTIVALRPIKPNVPWDLPNNIRPLDAKAPLGSMGQFMNIDPAGQTANVTNHLVNFGEEYVWHCHILGHEEGMIMRSMSIVVSPNAPSNLMATNATNGVALTWTDNSMNEINWTIQRASTSTGPWTTIATVNSISGLAKGTTATYTDTTAATNTAYYYRVLATNIVGDTAVYAAPAVGYPNMAVDSTPSNIASVTANLAVFVRGTDDGVYTQNWNGTTWGGWQSLGGLITSEISATTSGSNITIFVNGTDSGVYTQNYSGTAWSGWQSLGGIATSDLESVSLAGKTYVFVRGGDNGVYTQNWNGTAWSGWQSLGGLVTSKISATVSGSNITIFATGTDSGVYTQNYSGVAWSGWGSLGGIATSDLESVSLAGKTYVFVRGGDNGVYTQNWNGTAWSGWQSLGGLVTSRISATVSGSNITIFANGTDSGVYTQNWNGTAWSGWQGLGGIATAEPDSASSAGNTYVFVRGGDNGLYTQNWNGTAWSGWQSLGGKTIGAPEAISG